MKTKFPQTKGYISKASRRTGLWICLLPFLHDKSLHVYVRLPSQAKLPLHHHGYVQPPAQEKVYNVIDFPKDFHCQGNLRANLVFWFR